MISAKAYGEELATIDTRQLAPVLRRLVEIMGVAAALRLCKACGGTHLWVPKTPDIETRCGQALEDIEPLAALCRELPGGQWIPVPKADQILRQLRDKAIRECTLPVQQQAGLFGLTRAQIYNIRGEEAANDNQQELDL